MGRMNAIPVDAPNADLKNEGPRRDVHVVNAQVGDMHDP